MKTKLPAWKSSRPIKVGGNLLVKWEGTGHHHLHHLDVMQYGEMYLVVADTDEKYPPVGSASQQGPDGRWTGFNMCFKDDTMLNVWLSGDWTTAEYENRYGPTWWFVKPMDPYQMKVLLRKKFRRKHA